MINKRLAEGFFAVDKVSQVRNCSIDNEDSLN